MKWCNLDNSSYNLEINYLPHHLKHRLLRKHVDFIVQTTENAACNLPISCLKTKLLRYSCATLSSMHFSTQDAKTMKLQWTQIANSVLCTPIFCTLDTYFLGWRWTAHHLCLCSFFSSASKSLQHQQTHKCTYASCLHKIICFNHSVLLPSGIQSMLLHGFCLAWSMSDRISKFLFSLIQKHLISSLQNCSNLPQTVPAKTWQSLV